MRLFAEGKVRTLRLDYEKMNRESAQMVEDMIAEMLDCTEKQRSSKQAGKEFVMTQPLVSVVMPVY